MNHSVNFENDTSSTPTIIDVVTTPGQPSSLDTNANSDYQALQRLSKVGRDNVTDEVNVYDYINEARMIGSPNSTAMRNQFQRKQQI